MRVLVISSPYSGGLAAIVQDGRSVAGARLSEEHGLAALMAGLVASVMADRQAGLDLVAVVVGPGSFTGLRAGVAVGWWVGLGWGVPVVGVTVAEALADEAALSGAGPLSGRLLWTAIHARRGRVFIDAADDWRGCATDNLPASLGKVAVCGNAANLVAGTLAARGTDVMLTPYRVPKPVHVAAAGLARQAGALPALSPLPLYVDMPEAKLPGSVLRPSPTDVAA